MAFPGNAGRNGQDAFDHSSIEENAKNREDQGAEGARKKCKGGQIAEIAKNQAARANVAGVTRKKPDQATAENRAGESDEIEVTLIARAEDRAQDEQRYRVRQDVVKRTMQKRGKNDSRQPGNLPRNNAELIEGAVQEQIVDDEDYPAERYQENDRDETL